MVKETQSMNTLSVNENISPQNKDKIQMLNRKMRDLRSQMFIKHIKKKSIERKETEK